jgi:hypothetical protein
MDPGKAINLGVAAHITAASPGGPRFDPKMDAKLRSSPENGIWLCQNCAKLVDDDAFRFPTEVLRQWKSSAEEAALQRIGRPADPGEQEVVQDKWCDLEYIERAGIGAQLRDAGFKLVWSRAENVSTRLDVEGWEEVVWKDMHGASYRFKVRDRLCEYLLLLRKPNDRSDGAA